MCPEDYVRKQTLTNAERYSTPKLKELEDIILNAEDKLFSLEYDVFADVREKISAEVVRIQRTAGAIAQLDVFASLATVADQNNYVCPKINNKGIIDVKDGKTPCCGENDSQTICSYRMTHILTITKTGYQW